MNLLFDTNILLYVCRNRRGLDMLQWLNPEDSYIYTSFASIAEIQSIAFQNRWGPNKIQRLDEFLQTVRVIDISDLLLETYIGIDAYSQRNHPDYRKYPFDTPRNMGKNDLYIAATASILNLKLVTTDGDFDHLDSTFISLQKITTPELKQFFD